MLRKRNSTSHSWLSMKDELLKVHAKNYHCCCGDEEDCASLVMRPDQPPGRPRVLLTSGRNFLHLEVDDAKYLNIYQKKSLEDSLSPPPTLFLPAIGKSYQSSDCSQDLSTIERPPTSAGKLERTENGLKL